MRVLKLILAYDGTAYAGWQIQPNQPTIQEELQQALTRITGESIRAVASGRTDAGVHALRQVIRFATDSELAPEAFVRATNAYLPKDIAVLDACEASTAFHPIRDAVRKRYRYVIHNAAVRDVFARNYCWHYPHALDSEAMQEAAIPLVGRHDFASYQSSGAPRESTVRTVSALEVQRDGKEGPARIVIEVEADGFLYNMVRAIVGTLVEVGRGAEDKHWPAKVLAARDRRAGGPTAPPQGLFLVKVDYGD